ncbi:MAG: hypothetical protein ACK4M2_01580 [Brevundimonas sp.]
MAEDWKAEGEDYQASAHVAQAMVARLLKRLHALEHDRSGSTDMGPFVAGLVGGVIEVVSETDMPLSDLRAAILTVFDSLAPQFEMERHAKQAGAFPSAAGCA